MILQPIEQLSFPIKWQKKWEGMAKSLILKNDDWANLYSIQYRSAIALRDTDKPLDDTAKYHVYQKKERLE
jgi:hypothetical protein